MTQGSLAAEYGPEYYQHHLGSVPYERSTHWLNFFSIIADQLIRGLQPRRVLDAGCAMGFLVEAFWDRGIFCEGFDISDFAISQVRRDIQPHCSVSSITEPIRGEYDLVTCIEVLEHLAPDQVRTAVGNLCAATHTILFSSHPSDFTEPTHYSVHPPVFWLQLFSEFDFWPDARFDASFVTSHAMLLRKGNRPPDDYLRLFSEYIRYKIAFESRSTEANSLTATVISQTATIDALRSQEAQNSRNHSAELQDHTVQKDRARDQTHLQIQQLLAHAAIGRDTLLTENDRLRKEQNQHDNQQIVEWTRQEQHLSEKNEEEQQRLAQRIQDLSDQLELTQGTLHKVLHSRAWRLAERCRWPLRKLRNWRSTRPAQNAISSVAHQSLSPVVGAEPVATAEILPVHTPDAAYQRWINEQEPDQAELSRQRESSKSLIDPVISIVVPVHQTDHGMLRACVQSVLDQTYPNWQLCVAFTPDQNTANADLLNRLAREDQRVQVVALPTNHGISENSNAAIGLATGEFIGFLDHDDTLAPFALFEVAGRLNTDEELDIVYSDHDYLDAEQGLRVNPIFKPAWSPEIMFSANYITHFTVIRKTLVDRVGYFNAATDGAQDWDLFMRATKATSRISHVSKVLYHWRMHAGSTANNDSAKSYAAAAQLLAIQRHLDKCGMDAESEVAVTGLLHVRFRQTPEALVSIIIPTKDRVDLLERCLSTLFNLTEPQAFEVLIVDTGSKEEATRDYFRTLESNSRVRVLWHPGPFNYSAANNRAVREANGDFLLFLNNDVEITHTDWLKELTSWADQKEIGVVGAKLLRPNGNLQHAGVVLGMSGFADHPFADGPAHQFGIAGSSDWYRNFLAVTGACMMMRREVFEEIGGFDESFTLCGSDVEICLRAWSHGYRIVYNPFSELIHHERQTRGTDVPPRDFVESFKHYRPWLASGDPYWNSNLSRWSCLPAFRSFSEKPSLGFAEEFAAKSESALLISEQRRPLTEEERIVGWFDCSQFQFDQIRLANSAIVGERRVKRLLWFIPEFEVPFYGGIYTILRLSQFWAETEGVEVLFALCASVDHRKTVRLISQVHRLVKPEQVFVLNSVQGASELPAVDADICTLWTTAYYSLHHTRVARRFYLIQDFEPAFYCAGSVSAIVESTYRMGLYGIANTVSLKQMYESEYGGKAIHFTPRINKSVFYCDQSINQRSNAPLQVFFYGRPRHARNAFELVKEAMRLLKNRLGSRVRILSAGEQWHPAEYGLNGIVENLGLLEYAETARLYRESQVGVVMMLTRHPSYIPLELMASGCLTVTNVNSWTSWLLKDGVNCLLTPATASAIADTVERGLTDAALRQQIRSHALEMVESQYLDWSTEARTIYSYLCDPEAALAGSTSAAKEQEKAVAC